MQAAALLQDLKERTQEVIHRIQSLQNVPDNILNSQATTKSWSALECLEHLNRYGDFYLDELEQQMAKSKHSAAPTFQTGWLGNWFANSVADKPKINTMPSPPSMNPTGSQVDRDVVDIFLQQQQRMLGLLEQAAQVDLTKTKTGITLTRWIRLRLGDTLRVVIYHNQRHVSQALRAVVAAQKAVI